MDDYGSGNYNETMQYDQGGYQDPSNDPNKAVMTMGEWLITLIITFIPCVNIVMLFVWGFGNGNENRKNFCRAQLIIMAVSAVISFIFSSVLIAMLGSVMNQLG